MCVCNYLRLLLRYYIIYIIYKYIPLLYYSYYYYIYICICIYICVYTPSISPWVSSLWSVFHSSPGFGDGPGADRGIPFGGCRTLCPAMGKETRIDPDPWDGDGMGQNPMNLPSIGKYGLFTYDGNIW